jgi:molybdenum cofactor biosynthesis enzyme MoaA
MSNVYCSTKFKELLVEVQGRLLYNCSKALPERVDLDWLEKNPGKLFHTPTMIADRELMLSGKRSRSCQHGCYRYEDQGLNSKRILVKNNEFISDVHNPLKSIRISLSNDCNLTCTYCSAEQSTAWLKDIDKNGEYNIENYKNKNDNLNKLYQKLQQDRSTDLKFFKLLLKELSLSSYVKHISIMGGEPFLHNGLIKFLEILEDKEIRITSGLGVPFNRFRNIIDKIKKNKNNISLCISAETTNKFFEFIRYGISWNDFLQNIDYVEKNGIKIKFISTITNFTSFGIVDFYDMFGKKHEIEYNPVTDRRFLQPNVLDDSSKKNLIALIQDRIDNNFFNKLKTSVSKEYNEIDRKNLSIFLLEFSRRRKLNLDIFPSHFLKWLDLV